MFGGILKDQPFSIPCLISFLFPWKQCRITLSYLDSSRIWTESASAFLVWITIGLFRSLATWIIFLKFSFCLFFSSSEFLTSSSA